MIHSTGNALRRLFDAQKGQMDADELKWFSGLSHSAISQADDIADTLSSLAMVISGGSSDGPDDTQLAHTLFMLAANAETVSALVYVGSEAELMVGKLKDQSTGQ